MSALQYWTTGLTAKEEAGDMKAPCGGWNVFLIANKREHGE